MICSSSPVPRVVTTSPWVSPRVNSAEPWVRGRMPTSLTIGRTVTRSRPSMRRPVSITVPRRMPASTFLKQSSTAPESAASSSVRPAFIASLAAAILVWRSCLSVVAKASLSAPSQRPRTLARRAERSGSAKLNGSFAAASARSTIMSITGCICWWPKTTAPSISSSLSS